MLTDRQFTTRAYPETEPFTGKVTYDNSAKVYEAWGDEDCQEFLGAFDTFREARSAVEEAGR